MGSLGTTFRVEGWGLRSFRIVGFRGFGRVA